MFGEFEIRQIPLSLSSNCNRVEKFLLSQGLRMEPFDSYFGIFDTDDEMIGGGGLDGRVIKGVALTEKARNGSLTNSLISRLRDEAAISGFSSTFIFTKPEYRQLFESLAYHTVGEAPEAVLLESDPRGISGYCKKLEKLRRPGVNGVIVMNCNPLTSGHRYLIEKAAQEVDNLYIIPVKEDASEFTESERRQMLANVVGQTPGAVLCPGSDYIISAATFPTYFLKDISHASVTHITLDLNIFASHIAPALGAAVRFAGSEPTDLLTAEYNRGMARILPQYGIEFREISRLECEGRAISASEVRKLISEMRFDKAAALIDPASLPAVLARLACAALKTELELTPKPGLVDNEDNGSHADMDFAMMSRSIQALKPYFSKLASIPESAPLNEIIEVGKQAEQAMLAATGGINTHRGALFSLGLAVVAASRAYASGNETLSFLQTEIVEMASAMESVNTGSHGSEAIRNYGAKGALMMAREGYADAFGCWLPYLRSLDNDQHRLHKTLLKIMTTLQDTNLYHRGGLEGYEFARKTAENLLSDFSIEAMRDANDAFRRLNLSPGGSADMLSLTLFLYAVGDADGSLKKLNQ